MASSCARYSLTCGPSFILVNANPNPTQVRNTLAAVGGEFVDAAAVSITSLSVGSVVVATRTVCATQALAEQYMRRLRDNGELAFQSNAKLLPLLPVTFSNLQVLAWVEVWLGLGEGQG